LPQPFAPVPTGRRSSTVQLLIAAPIVPSIVTRILVPSIFIVSTIIAGALRRVVLGRAFVLSLLLPFLTALIITTLAPLFMLILREQRQRKQNHACNQPSGNVAESPHCSPLSRPVLRRLSLKITDSP
jgi:hypothetical protein